MNLVMQVFQGVTMATLAEGMALADRAGLQQRDVMEILALTNMACPLFLDKGNGEASGRRIFRTELFVFHLIFV